MFLVLKLYIVISNEVDVYIHMTLICFSVL
jgi:hypothetical protein